MDVQGKLIVDGAELVLNATSFTAANIDLINGAVLTVPDPDASGYTSLILDASGDIYIDTTSSIDLTGKGFTQNGPDNTNNSSSNVSRCHGGDASSSLNAPALNCAYGRYARASFGGSSAGSTVPGGGYVKILANQLTLDGAITARGKPSIAFGSIQSGGAGGGIDIDVTTLIGSGSLDVQGVEGETTPASGGRISIRGDLSGWNGNTSARGGEKTRNPSSTRLAGSGTVFIKDTSDTYGSLILNNEEIGIGNEPNLGMTGIEHIGRLGITGVTNLGNGLWEIDALPGAADLYETGSITASGAGSVTYHSFSIEDDFTVQITLDPESFDPDFVLFRDDGSLDTTDFVGTFESRTDGARISTTFDLIAGDYLIAVSDEELTSTEAVNGQNANSASGNYEIWVETFGNWKETNEELEFGLQGLLVDLDASTEAGSLYTVVSNTTRSLTVSTSDDLSSIVGQDLIGVHQFERLVIKNGALADFGGDRVVINDLANSEVSDATVRGISMPEAQLQYFASNNVNGVYSFDNIDVNDLTIRGSGFSFGNLNVQGKLTVDDAEVQITSGGLTGNNIDLINGANLTVPDPIENVSYTDLIIDITGEIYIDATSSIDASVKGFFGRLYFGPDGSTDRATRHCHGGNREIETLACSYGRYARARFAGSSDQNRVPGGGFIDLSAGTVTLDGLITASGDSGSTALGGAGGGINIEANTLVGFGSLDASGDDGTFNNSTGGGRISVHADLSQWSGTATVRGGAGNNTNVNPHTGSGTLFMKDTGNTLGNLTIDNEITTLDVDNYGLTAIESVGRHEIMNVTDLGNGQWQLTIGTSPWETSDQFDRGVQGLKVDLDASDEIGTLYIIESNTANTLTIATPDNLSGMVGQELVGVHQFETLVIKDGSLVDFGNDRVEINDLANSQVSNALIRNVEMPTSHVQHFATNNTNGSFAFSSVDVVDFDINSSGLSFESLNVQGILNINGGDTSILNLNAPTVNIFNSSAVELGTAQVSGNMDVLGSTITAPNQDDAGYIPLILDVAGELHIDSSSSIDVTGKGFDGQRYGPDNSSSNVTRACHAGDRANSLSSVPDCAFGRYAKANFGGSPSGGSTPGGGFVRILADQLTLDGVLLANGEASTSSSGGGGAGGGIDIDVSTLIGSGSLRAEGIDGEFVQPSGGGRISIRGDLAQWSGSMSARSGKTTGSNTTSQKRAGSGTVFIKDTSEPFGSLIIDNDVAGIGDTPNLGLTGVEHIGRHSITNVVDLGNGSWELSVGTSPWQATNVQFEYGVQGLQVDLNASDEAGPLYTIQSNTSNTLIIETADNLSGIVGQELIGVHQFDRLIIKDGALVDFGEDRVEVNDLANSEISDAAVQRIEMPEAQFQHFASNNVNGVYSLANIDITDLTISGSGFSFDGLNVQGKLTLDNAEVIMLGGQLTGNNIDLLNGAVLTVPNSDNSAPTSLIVDIVGEIYIDVTSSIDVSNKGFDERLYAPDASTSSSLTRYCHGGNRENEIAPCTYGRYAQTKFAGSSDRNRLPGGGFIDLTASLITLDGVISASGFDGTSALGGAGGGININASTLAGSGSLDARGDDGSFSNSAGGGRISVRADLSQWLGSATVRGGISNSTGTQVAGSGTLFMQDTANAFGSLFIDNENVGLDISRYGLTPIESVGRHTITNVNDLGGGQWQLTISTSAWTASDQYDRGVQGLKVDLDASDEIGTLYTIESNTSNSLTITTPDNLSGIVGQELIGVHQFEALVIKDGSVVDFGGDRIEVNDLANSEVSESKVQNLEWSETALQHFASNNVDGIFPLENLNIDDLTITGIGFSLNGLNVQGKLTLDGASVQVRGNQISGNNMDLLNGAILTVADPDDSGFTSLVIDLTGDLYIDATSAINLTGKGYDVRNYGPDDSSNLTASCHGGISAESSRDGSSICTYGRYSRAKFAGSGSGDSQVLGSGGGLLVLSANQLTLDGSIEADGTDGDLFDVGGGGGGVDIDVTTFAGFGSISARGSEGASSDFPSSGGGRISVRGDLTQWTGSIAAKGGPTPQGSLRAGSGTIFMHDTLDSNGSLTIDNGLSSLGGDPDLGVTFIEHVGRHEITGATDLGNGSWQLDIGASEWEVTDVLNERGIQGLEVDLDASDQVGTLYTVDSNTANGLIITTSDDLSGVVGQELIGVHQFEMLVIKDGALVDFGNDRIEINDTVNSILNDADIRNQDALSNFPP